MKRFLRHWRGWLQLVALLAAVGLWLGMSAWREQDRILARELDRLSTQSKVVEVNLTRQLTAIDLSLKTIQDGLPRWLGTPAGRQEGLQTLVSMEAALSAVRTFLVLDDKGNVTLSSRAELIGRNFYQREYLQAPLKGLDPARLYVSPPFKSVLGPYIFNLTRVIVDNQGRFKGAVSAAIDPQDTDVLLNSVRYTSDMRAMLVHGDGVVFISEPPLAQVMGMDLSGSDAFFSDHQRSLRPQSQFNGMVSTTQDHRLAVLQTVLPPALAMDRPLVVSLNREQAAVLSDWRQDVWWQASGFLLLAAVSLVTLAVFQRQRAQKVMVATRLKLATEASGVGIWEFDLVSKIYQWDTTMFALFGLAPEAAGPRNDEWTKLLSPLDLQRMRDATRATIVQNQPFILTFKIHRPDGQVRHMRNRAALYSDDQGLPRRLIGVTEDVTQRKQQEAELRVAAVAFESNESMLVTNAQVEILRVNQAFTSLFGYGTGDVLGKHPRLLKSGRHDADFYAAMWAQLVKLHHWQGELWNTRKNGEEFPCWLCITAVCDDMGGITHFVGTHTDITLRKASEDEVKRLAFFDPLTQLPNRRLLTDRLHQAITKAKRDHDHMALIYVDLDKFKPVNDHHGHAAGDMLLQAVAHRMRTCVRESDTVARVGGDEFVVLLSNIHHSNDALAVAEKIHTALRDPFELATGQRVNISSSAGLALYPDHGTDEATLSRHADEAMYAAKAQGRDQYVMYSAPVKLQDQSTGGTT